MGTTPEINIDDIDPAVYKAVVAHQTRKAITARWASLDKAERYAATQPARDAQAAKRAAKAAQADFLNEGGK